MSVSTGNNAHRRGKQMATETAPVVEQEDKELIDAQKQASETNKARTGIGTRVKVGKTRGRSTQVISFEQFDESIPESLPKTFNDLNPALQKVGLGVTEPELVEMVILGANDKLYEAASDELAKFVNPVWDKPVQNQFRLVVRNYAKGTGEDIEDVAKQMRTAFDKRHSS